MSEIGGGSVAVVCQRLYDNGNSVGTVAFIGERFVGLAVVFTRSLLDNALDVFVRHIVRLGFGDAVTQLGIGSRIGAASLTYGNGYLAPDLGKYFGSGAVDLLFFSLDCAPFGMS